MALPSAPFNTAKSIFAGLSVIKLKLDAALTGVTAATTVITKVAHGYLTGDQVEFTSGTGFTGLVALSTYYVTKLSADTFSVSATSSGSAIAVGTSSAGVFIKVTIFESRLLNSKLEQERKDLERPGTNGVLRKVRSVTTKETESFTFEMDEAKRLLEIFGGSLAGRDTGYCSIWLPDPDDASGYVALKSETDFAITISRDGDTKFGDGDFTKPSILIESNKQGAITWTADATA